MRQEVDGLSKYFERLVGRHHPDSGRTSHIAEVRIHSSNDTHFASSEAGDMRSAVDGTVEKLKRQLQRHKEKLNRRQLTRAERELLAARLPPEEESPRDLTAAPSTGTGSRAPRRSRDSARAAKKFWSFVDTRDGVVKIARRDGEESISVVEAEAEVEER